MHGSGRVSIPVSTSCSLVPLTTRTHTLTSTERGMRAEQVEFQDQGKVARRSPVSLVTHCPRVHMATRFVTYTGEGAHELMVACGMRPTVVRAKYTLQSVFSTDFVQAPRDAGSVTSVHTDGYTCTYLCSTFRSQLNAHGVSHTQHNSDARALHGTLKEATAHIKHHNSVDPHLAALPLGLWSGAGSISRLARTIVAHAALLGIPLTDVLARISWVSVDPGMRDLVTAIRADVTAEVLCIVRVLELGGVPGDAMLRAALTSQEPATKDSTTASAPASTAITTPAVQGLPHPSPHNISLPDLPTQSVRPFALRRCAPVAMRTARTAAILITGDAVSSISREREAGDTTS